MKFSSVIEDEEIVKKILKPLGLWDRKAKPPHKATGPAEVLENSIDYSVSQPPCLSDVACEESGFNKWLYVDVEYPEVYPL